MSAPPGGGGGAFEVSSLFSFGSGDAFGTSQAPLPPPPPPPPPVEVTFEEGAQEASGLEPVVINPAVTLYKGKASTLDVFGVKNSDLVPGKYEGGLKLWEGSLDLVKTLWSEIQECKLEIRGKRVLEIGCGHGLPGIFTLLNGAAIIHFQDFNAEVLRCLTIPNVKANIAKLSNKECSEVEMREINTCGSLGFFAGDWNEVHELLHGKAADVSSEREGEGYDLILMSETVYSLSSLPSLHSLLKKCLAYPSGAVYLSGKKHYFGVGGGTRQFIHLVKKEDTFEPQLLGEVADGSSNLREVWRLSFK